MKRVHSISLVSLASCVAAFAFLASGVCAQCVPPAPSVEAYRVYYHNAGLSQNCVQDFDMDLKELFDFTLVFASYIAPTAPDPVVADIFAQCPPSEPPDSPHGEIVERYFRCAYGAFPIEINSTSYAGWAEMVLGIAADFSRGTVANLSNGVSNWTEAETQAVEAAYASEVLLVGAPTTFPGSRPADRIRIGDKCLTTWLVDGRGLWVGGGPGSSTPVNFAAVAVPTNWYNGDEYRIAENDLGEYCANSWDEHGSFSTPLLSGSVKYIADVVATRNVPPGQFVHKVLDYVISACDRNVSPEGYLHRTGESLPSFGPWSTEYGYGVFSAWKAMIYAYGFGKLEAKDSALHPGQTNPPTVFSDDFYLRGDLFVPAEQLFRVASLASVALDPTAATPEGPTTLGHYSGLQEIRVAGAMEVETSRQNPVSGKNGVNASVTIDSQGACDVESGGTITIGAGQVLHVYAGGTLTIETGGQVIIEYGGTLILDTGGEIVIEDGGLLKIFGDYDHFGTLSMQSGADLRFEATGTALFGADVVIPAGADFASSGGASITIASTDAGGTGNDAARVEIICHGNFQSVGSDNAMVMFAGQNAGAGNWSGILIDPADISGSAVQFTSISDAETGIAFEGGGGSLTLVGIDVTDCTNGIRVRRDGLTLSGVPNHGAIKDCTYGMRIHCSINMDHMMIHDNTVGLWVTGMDPVTPTGVFPYVRRCSIFANNFGVHTADNYAAFEMGTVSDYGENDFAGPYPYRPNTYHVWAIDPMYTLYAQYNWWGTKKVSLIAPKIKVWWGTFQQVCIFEPILTAPPSLASQDPRSEEPVPIAASVHLDQNYPNPFNPTTQIRFGLEERGWVALTIYDVSGRVVRELVNGEVDAGDHVCTWDGKDARGASVASGIYFYRLNAGNFTATKKMLMLR